MKTPFVLLAIVVMITGVSLTNQTQTVESSNDKEKFLQAVNFLENNPLDEKAKETRKWAMPYSRKVDAPFCEKLSSLFFANKVRGEVMSQYLMKTAAYHLKQNNKAYDIGEAQLAGLKSALVVYEKILAKDKSARYKKFDKLIKLKNNNQLMKTVKSANCK